MFDFYYHCTDVRWPDEADTNEEKAVEKVLTHLHRKCNMNYQRGCFVIIIIVITFNFIISLAHVSCIVQLRRTQEFRNTSCLQRFQSSSTAAGCRQEIASCCSLYGERKLEFFRVPTPTHS